LTRKGQAYQVTEAVCAPKPLQQPHPPLWFGEATPGVLDLCARLGQGWNTTPVSLSELRRRLALLDDACRRAGRPLAELELSLETQVLVAPDRPTLRARLAEMAELAHTSASGLPAEIAPFIDTYLDDPVLQAFVGGASDTIPPRLAETWIVGTPDEVEERLRDYAAEGIAHIMLWFMDAPRREGLELFAAEVMPRFR
jgi:alkanesulfonate monooxygenase SsuD/methylene tetrahydromethanopterin reductase-like flavin-dependent oxidoreductase (luciferase family)